VELKRRLVRLVHSTEAIDFRTQERRSVHLKRNSLFRDRRSKIERYRWIDDG